VGRARGEREEEEEELEEEREGQRERASERASGERACERASACRRRGVDANSVLDAVAKGSSSSDCIIFRPEGCGCKAGDYTHHCPAGL